MVTSVDLRTVGPGNVRGMSADRPPQQPRPGNSGSTGGQWPAQDPWQHQGDAPQPAPESPQVHGVPVSSDTRRSGPERPHPSVAAPQGSAPSGLRMAQIAMVVLFALALVATVVMVFSDNELWMRIGLLAALWSALVGALLFARERRQSQTAADREAELKRVYSLELESEVSARRERELNLREELREEVRAENEESISSLRVEVMALRSQLEQLGVQPIVDGDPAVGARKSHPLLAASADRAAGFGDTENAFAQAPQAGPSPQVREHAVAEEPAAERPVPQTPPRPRPYDEMPSAEVTSSMRKVNAQDPAPSSDSWVPPAAASTSTVQPDDVVAPEVPSYFRDAEPAPAFTPEPEPEPTPAPEPEPAPTRDDSESTRPGGPHTDRFRSFEGFRLTAPPSFTDDAELPDFDAPTGFEPATGVEQRERFAASSTAPVSEPTPDFFGGRHGRRSDDDAPAAAATADSDLYAPRHGRAADPVESEVPAEQTPEPAAEPAPEESPRRRRRAAEESTGSRHSDSGGTSVADLLARFGESERSSGGGGRRRRED